MCHNLNDANGMTTPKNIEENNLNHAFSHQFQQGINQIQK